LKSTNSFKKLYYVTEDLWPTH